MGGPESSDMRDWLAGAVASLFPPYPAPTPADVDNEYIEDFLQGVLEDEFKLLLEENEPSLKRVAEQIVRMRRECEAGNFENVEVLRKKWMESRGKKFEVVYEDGEEGDTDGDSDEDSEDEDEDMGDAPKLQKEKAPPEVDEEGFTTVSRKR